MKTNDIYKDVTDRIVAQLEKGVAPWRQPWESGLSGLPKNIVSRAAYRGVNVWLLWLSAEANGWTSGLFGTYKQWLALGGNVQRGQHGVRIVYWNISKDKIVDNSTGEVEEKRRFFARNYTVFALEQCAGVALDRFRRPVVKREFIDYEPAEKVIAATGAEIRLGGGRACYHPMDDYIQLPPKESFESPAGFYSVALHELTHWTGHASRLNRLDTLARFGSSRYAVEELVAEMGAAFLTAALGVPNIANQENSVAYLENWLSVLRADSKAIFSASSSATKAADLILGTREESASETIEEPQSA